MAGELTGIGLILIGYLLGSIPPSYVIGRLFYKVDIRNQGSGNVGGANFARLFGKKIAALVVLIDIFKGTVAVIIAQQYASTIEAEVGFLAHEENIIAITAFAVVFGHCYSLFLKFSGGKGGATTAGILIAIDITTFSIVILFWIVILLTTRFSSLANLISVILIPLLLSFRVSSSVYEYLGIALVVLIFFKHRDNIGRLASGVERKVGSKEKVA